MSTIFQRIKRIVAPITGKELVLYDDEAKIELRNQQKILNGIEEETDHIDDAIPKIKNRLNSIGQKVNRVNKEIADVELKISKASESGDQDLVASYQRQLILLQDKLSYYSDSKKYLTESVGKYELVFKEARITGELLQERIEDARLCYELSGQIKLMGGALASFGKMANKSKSEPFDLGERIKGLQSSINEINGGRLMALTSGAIGGKK